MIPNRLFELVTYTVFLFTRRCLDLPQSSIKTIERCDAFDQLFLPEHPPTAIKYVAGACDKCKNKNNRRKKCSPALFSFRSCQKEPKRDKNQTTQKNADTSVFLAPRNRRILAHKFRVRLDSFLGHANDLFQIQTICRTLHDDSATPRSFLKLLGATNPSDSFFLLSFPHNPFLRNDFVKENRIESNSGTAGDVYHTHCFAWD